MKRIIFALTFATAIAMVSTNFYSQSRKAEKAVDPVCGLTVDKKDELSYVYKREKYFFCSNKDLNTFRQNPERYARKR
jgi:YHS domain-containing protein